MPEPDESPERVFEALLTDWYGDEIQIIGEWGIEQKTEEDLLDEQREVWRHRWRAACRGHVDP
jgi:hypothetical protein